MKLLGATAADTTPYIFHHAQYIVNGRDVEVLYYDARGRKRFRDTVPGGDLTPVVLENGKVTGTGWPHWEQVAKAANIVPLRRDARN
jgi:hypothetical protein